MNQTDSDHALAMLLANEYDDYDYYTRYDNQEKEYEQKPSKNKATINKLKPKNTEGMNIGKFTDEEVVKFKQGLELFGRDWTKVQIHVIRLQNIWKRGIPMLYEVMLKNTLSNYSENLFHCLLK